MINSYELLTNTTFHKIILFEGKFKQKKKNKDQNHQSNWWKERQEQYQSNLLRILLLKLMKKEQIIQHNFFEKVTTLWEIERLKIQHDHIFLSLNQNIKIIYKKNLIEFWIVSTNII